MKTKKYNIQKFSLKKVHSIKDNKRFVATVLISGLGFIPLMLFCPLFLFNLILGFLILIVDILYYKRMPKSKKKTAFIMFLTFTGFIFMGMYFGYALMDKTDGLEVNENGCTYQQSGIRYEAKTWYFEPPKSNDYGEVQDIRIPSWGYIVYDCDNDHSIDFNVEFGTNLLLKDLEVEVKFYGSDSQYYAQQTDLLKQDTLELGWVGIPYVFNCSGWFDCDYEYRLSYTFDDVISVSNPDGWEYIHIVFEGKVDFSDLTNFMVSPMVKVELGSDDNKYSMSTSYEGQEASEGTLLSLLLYLFSDAVIMIMTMVFIIIFFTIGYLLLWVTGNSETSKWYLMLMVCIGLLSLFAGIIHSDNIILISWVIDVLENIRNSIFNWWDWAGIFLGIFKILAMIIAIWIWANTVGYALMWCIGMYILWTSVIGDIRSQIEEYGEKLSWQQVFGDDL